MHIVTTVWQTINKMYSLFVIIRNTNTIYIDKEKIASQVEKKSDGVQTKSSDIMQCYWGPTFWK